MADSHLHDWDALPRMTDGPERPLRDALRPLFARARQIDIVAAFAQPGGVSLIAPMLLDALRRGATARLLTGDYLTLTHPRALAMLLDLAALGGALIAPKVSVVPAMGVEVIVLAFAVVVIGGLGSLAGAALGALIVGLVRSLAVHYMPEVELFSVYLVMALVLIVRPKGLFAAPEARRI